MATTTEADLKKINEELAQLRSDISSLAGTLNDAARHQAKNASDRVRSSLEDGRERLIAAEAQAEKQIAAHPMQSVGVAFGVGFLVGRLAAR